MAKKYRSLRGKIPPERQNANEKEARKLIDQIVLEDLRRSLNLTEEKVDRILGINQSNISNLEGENDLYLSTMSRLVWSLGAGLKLVAIFPDREVVVYRSERREA